MKPFWEVKHDWWESDFKFEYFQRGLFAGMLQKHPDDAIGTGFWSTIRLIDKRIARLQGQYKSIYGIRFSIRRFK